MKLSHLKTSIAIALLIIISPVILAQNNATNYQLTNIQKKIRKICVDRYRSPGDFVQFANKLMALGVNRQTYDVLNDDLSFYSKDAMLYHFSGSEIDKSIYKNAFHLGEVFNLDKLKKAIENLDSKKISAVKFHQEIAQAGIAYVSVFLEQRKIYYLSHDGKYFLERY